MHQFYESIGEFLREVERQPRHRKDADDSSWHNRQTFDQALENIRKGRPESVAKAAKLFEELSSDSIETSQLQWQYDLAGAIPCVPSYLAGEPMSMRRAIPVKVNTAPVCVFASVCMSAGFNQEHIEKRGIAILALCQKLSNFRPLELYLYADIEGSRENGGAAIPVIKLETSPLDLTTASYAITDAAFLRHLCFKWGYQHGFETSWAWHEDPNSQRAQVKIRQELKAETQDLIIPGGYYQDPIIREPVKWINEQLKKYVDFGNDVE